MADNDMNDNANTSKASETPPTSPNPQPHDTTVIHTAAPATSQSNANMLMILVMFVILLVGVAFAFTLKNKKDEEEKRKDDLKSQLSSFNVGEDGLYATGVSLDARITKIVEHANNIRADYDKMRVGYTKVRQELNGIKSMQSGNMNTITSISTENSKLKQEIANLRRLAADAKTYQQQASMLSEANRELEIKNAKLRNGPTSESMKALQDNLTRERLETDKLSQEITSLKRKMTGMVDSRKVSELSHFF